MAGLLLGRNAGPTLVAPSAPDNGFPIRRGSEPHPQNRLTHTHFDFGKAGAIL